MLVGLQMEASPQWQLQKRESTWVYKLLSVSSCQDETRPRGIQGWCLPASISWEYLLSFQVCRKPEGWLLGWSSKLDKWHFFSQEDHSYVGVCGWWLVKKCLSNYIFPWSSGKCPPTWPPRPGDQGASLIWIARAIWLYLGRWKV